MIAFWQKSDDKPRQCAKKQRHHSANKEGLYSQGYGLPRGHLWLLELDCKEGRTTKNWCLWTVVLVDSRKSPEQQGGQTSQFKGSSTLNIHCNDWFWSWSTSILVIWCEQPTHWKSPWCWERSRAEGEESVRGWDDWMASLRLWMWTPTNSWEMVRDREAWYAVQSMELQSVRCN